MEREEDECTRYRITVFDIRSAQGEKKRAATEGRPSVHAITTKTLGRALLSRGFVFQEIEGFLELKIL